MLIRRVMRTPVTTITPDTSVRAAAALMAELGLGALPVCDNGRPIGILTDRDIVIRWVPNAIGDINIGRIMSPQIVTCLADQTIECAAHLMSDMQIRRLVVVDRDGIIAGIITLGDIANDASEELAGQTLGEVVETR
ncbi:CBS domain-containing protein [Pararhodobacter sp.]|uniref:CBS domain-containing protein n=1 Tax=Pararhodobacter sp. TaxID=2127056 RepID=UPI002AFF1635|nr:CBS domain-containing protein [Pararhodobacter sp.]